MGWFAHPIEHIVFTLGPYAFTAAIVAGAVVGALLTAGFASAMGAAIAASPESSDVTSSVQSELTKSFSTAADTAQNYPQYSIQIIAAAKSSFLDGANWAYAAGLIAVALGSVLVFFMFPRKDEEESLLASYHAADTRSAGTPG